MILKVRIKDQKAFKIIMIKKGFTQRGLSKAANISDTTINHLINGKRCCSPEVAAKIRNALNLEFDDLFFIDGDCSCEQDVAITDVKQKEQNVK